MRLWSWLPVSFNSSITASVGFAQNSPDTLALRDAMERADHALYQAKRDGRNRSVIDNWPQQAMTEEAQDTPGG